MNLEAELKNAIEVVGLKTIRMTAAFSPWKAYRDDPLTEFLSLPFPEVITAAQIKTVKNSRGFGLNIKSNGLSKTTQAFFEGPFKKGLPTIIFHHGAGEINYAPKLKRMLKSRNPELVNLISIKAADHNSRKQFLETGFSSLASQQAILAGSVLMVDYLVRWLGSQGSKVLITGTSMGGIVASWHWFLFGSGDFYIPVAAYPNVSEILLGKGYQGVTDHRLERQKLKTYQQAFRVDPKRAKGNRAKVEVILGQRDIIVDYQKAAKFWRGFSVQNYPYGHTVSYFKGKEIGDLILKKAQELG